MYGVVNWLCALVEPGRRDLREAAPEAGAGREAAQTLGHAAHAGAAAVRETTGQEHVFSLSPIETAVDCCCLLSSDLFLGGSFRSIILLTYLNLEN